jgi:hypothetical protein
MRSLRRVAAYSRKYSRGKLIAKMLIGLSSSFKKRTIGSKMMLSKNRELAAS